MTKILFVCHGNICRSPMAEFVMKDLVTKAGRADEFYIESAATSAEELGNPVYPPVMQLLKQKGIDAGGKRARRMRIDDLNSFDLLIGMDHWNLRNMEVFFGKSTKIQLLLERDVQDPWYTNDFDTCYRDVVEGCKQLLRRL